VRALINGIGWVTAAGLGRGRQRLGFSRPAGPLPKLSRRMLFAEPDQRFGRLDEYSRLGLAAITMTLRDAGMAEDGQKRPVGVIAATTHGCLTTDLAYLDTMIPHNGAMASPNLFAYTLPNCFLGEAAIRFGFTGPGFIIQEPDPAGYTCLSLAMAVLGDGDAQTMLAGVCDLSQTIPATVEPQPPAAAVFFALGLVPGPAGPPYGVLQFDSTGSLSFMGQRVTGIFDLVQACLHPAGHGSPVRRATVDLNLSTPESG